MPSLDLGASYSNINLGRTLAGSQLAAGWRVGGAYTLDRHVLFALSTELQDKAMKRFQAGVEYLIGNLEQKSNVLALRAGYQANWPSPELSGLTGLTLGLGYTVTRNFTLDYAMLPTGDLGISHRISLTFKFGCPEKQEPAQPQAAGAPEPAIASAIVAPIVVKSVLLEDSHFDFDKSTLRPEGMKVLRDNVQLLKDNPKATVRVAGYTSMMGTADYNQRLSERRATAVEGFLISEGISPGRISTIGYGATRPATYEATPGLPETAAAKSNMRVLFEVTVK
jgi:outer membrane protein OmpA-like peptidoglycan-associated protein